MNGPPASALSLRQAVALGLLHGPAELLPISSSAHTTLAPWLLGWRYGELDPAVRKSFEVALHAGTALGLLTRPPWQTEAVDGGRCAPQRAWSSVPVPQSGLAARIATLAGAIGPPAIAGFALGETIEQRFGTPRTIAAGLFAGSLALATGELHGGSRRACQARPADGLALGLAQALALIPGLSRSGATTAAARLRGFAALDADRLSWQVGLPVIAGAALLQGARQARGGVQADQRCALAAGGATALLSTHLSARLLTPGRRLGLLRAAIGYRMALAVLVTRTMRSRAAGTPNKSK
ncbi:MAG: undecaprenyl-diphosphate phosphatase [Solirubrobacteraceae bacterium]